MNWQRLWAALKVVVAAIAARFSHSSPPNVAPEQAPEPPVEPQDAPTEANPTASTSSSQVLAPDADPALPEYLFNTPLEAKHSVRLICDEEGLTWDDKNALTACVKQES